MAPPEQIKQPAGWVATLSTLVTLIVTNVLKLLGGYLVYLEAKGQARGAIVLAGIAMGLSSQALENVVLGAIDKFFARG